MNARTWSVVSFPCTQQRQEFLDQVRLWNAVEELPRIETKVLDDGLRLHLFAAVPRPENILKLIEAFGGTTQQPLLTVAAAAPPGGWMLGSGA